MGDVSSPNGRFLGDGIFEPASGGRGHPGPRVCQPVALRYDYESYALLSGKGYLSECENVDIFKRLFYDASNTLSLSR